MSEADERQLVPGAPDSNTLHLGCGDDQPAGWHNLDANPAVEPDCVWDVTDVPWPFVEDSFSRVVARNLVEHLCRDGLLTMFDEVARVLQTDGHLTIVVPLGVNDRTDHDHELHWTYESPEQYSRSHQRSWDPTVPFELEERDVNVWLGGPLAKVSPLYQALSAWWPAWTADRCYGGELTATYRRVDA